MKNYLLLFLVLSMMHIPHLGNAQMLIPTKTSSLEIEELAVFPNPIKTDQLYITTKNNLPKIIEIYDVLGNRVIASKLLGKSINISKLASGIYILKIKENELSATRKLVVR